MTRIPLTILVRTWIRATGRTWNESTTLKGIWLRGFVLLLSGAMLMGTGLGYSYRRASATVPQEPDWTANLIRLHIVANSDTVEDQAMKRAVRDAVLAAVTPLFLEADDLTRAKVAIAQAIPVLEETAAGVITDWGADHPVTAQVGKFAFPGRAYGQVFLPAGEYTALRLVIGAGAGANWWCVLFPPMCFVDWATGVVLEPAPGSRGSNTMAVPRKDLVAMVDEEALAQIPVRGRSAILEWLRRTFFSDPAKLSAMR